MKKRRSKARKTRFVRDPWRSKQQRRRKADLRDLTERELDEDDPEELHAAFRR